MKKTILLTILSLGISQSYAAEIYNKDGNKLDLYGGIRARHYFSDNKKVDGDATFLERALKEKHRLMITLLVSENGNTNLKGIIVSQMVIKGIKQDWHLLDLNLIVMVLLTMVVTGGSIMM